MQSLAIVVMSIVAAIFYGILHDQVTARVCVEYFTIGHPKIIESQSPTVLAFAWGVVATWWVGLPLGVALAVAARAGRRPKRSVASLVRPIGILLAVMYLCAAIAGVIGYVLASRGVVHLVGSLATDVPATKHAAFLADGFAHTASYATGLIGGLIVVAFVFSSRRRLAA